MQTSECGVVPSLGIPAVGGREWTDIPRFPILYESFRFTDLKKTKKKKIWPPLLLSFLRFLSKKQAFFGRFFHFFGAGQNDLFTWINHLVSITGHQQTSQRRNLIFKFCSKCRNISFLTLNILMCPKTVQHDLGCS